MTLIGHEPYYAGTRINEPATFRGVAGDAWRARVPEVGHRGRPSFDATVGGFIVRAPGVHVFWDHYLVSVIHLRPIDGEKSPVIRRPGATHELIIAALNPERPLPPLDWTDDYSVSFLTPIDVEAQFVAANDAVADRILELSVRTIVDGLASPDQDWRAWWERSLEHTARHFADGTHGLGRTM